MNEQKPTAEAQAKSIVFHWKDQCGYELSRDTLKDLEIDIAALITAKDAEIERAIREACKYLSELEAARTENQQQRALLVEVLHQGEAMFKSLTHMQWCQHCGESSWDECEDGQQAITDMQAFTSMLSTPTVVELLEEGNV